MPTKAILIVGLVTASIVCAGCNRMSSMSPTEKAKHLARYAKWDEAIAVCNEVLATDPENTDMLLTRANAYAGTGEYEKAVADLTEVIRLLPDDPEAYHRRAIAYSRLGKEDLAIADRRHARDIDTAAKTAFVNSPPLRPIELAGPVPSQPSTGKDGMPQEGQNHVRELPDEEEAQRVITEEVQRQMAEMDSVERDEEATATRKSDAERLTELLHHQNNAMNAALARARGAEPGNVDAGAGPLGNNAPAFDDLDVPPAPQPEPPAPTWQLANPTYAAPAYSFGTYGNIGVAPAQVTTGIDSRALAGSRLPSATTPAWGPLGTLGSPAVTSGGTNIAGTGTFTTGLPSGVVGGTMSPGRYYPGPVYVPNTSGQYSSGLAPSATGTESDTSAQGAGIVPPTHSTLPSTSLPGTGIAPPSTFAPGTFSPGAALPRTTLPSTGHPGTSLPGYALRPTISGGITNPSSSLPAYYSQHFGNSFLVTGASRLHSLGE